MMICLGVQQQMPCPCHCGGQQAGACASQDTALLGFLSLTGHPPVCSCPEVP
jgi:hypothetical protein